MSVRLLGHRQIRRRVVEDAHSHSRLDRGAILLLRALQADGAQGVGHFVFRLPTLVEPVMVQQVSHLLELQTRVEPTHLSLYRQQGDGGAAALC